MRGVGIGAPWCTVKITVSPAPWKPKTPWMVHYRPQAGDRKQRRHFYRTKVDAETMATSLKNQVHQAGAPALALTPAEIREYREAKAVVGSADLVQAAKEWRERVAGVDSPTLAAALEAFLEDQQGNSPGYQYALKGAIGGLIEKLGVARRVAEPSAGEIESALLAFPYATETRANMRRMFSTFMAWCRRRGWRIDDPLLQVRRVRVARPTPHFYTVDQVKRLLEAVGEGAPWLLPSLALRLFAGVRSYEVKRLAKDWRDDVRPDQILVRAEVAKGRAGSPRPRLIEGLPNVGAWLGLGALWWPSWGDEMLRSAIGDAVPLLKNGMRHTFGTYAVAYFESYEKTAKLMGNSAEMVKKHYAGLATRQQAREFFALTPTAWET